MKKVVLALLIALTVVSLGFAGGDGETGDAGSDAGLSWIVDSEDGILPGVNPLEVAGDIVVAGSSTVFPLAENLIARFYDEGYAQSNTLTYTSIGSSAGFERFAGGDSDISGASRPIRPAEVEEAQANNLEPLEFTIAFDALAVVINPANTWATDLTFEELAIAFSTAETWADVRAGFPEVEISRYIPGTDSGTFGYFVEEIYDDETEPILNAARTQLSEDDNVLVQGVEGEEGAIGFFGFAYYVEEQDRLGVLDIEGVTPSAATVADLSYPLARPLFMYSDANIMRDKPHVAAFLNFVLTYGGEEAQKIGYFLAPEARVNEAKEQWLDVMEGLY